MNELGIVTQARLPNSPELRAKILYTFQFLRLTDAETVALLRDDGFDIDVRALGRRRREMGLLKRHKRAHWEDLDNMMRELLQQELDDNMITGYGEGQVYTYMRSKYCIVGK